MPTPDTRRVLDEVPPVETRPEGAIRPSSPSASDAPPSVAPRFSRPAAPSLDLFGEAAAIDDEEADLDDDIDEEDELEAHEDAADEPRLSDAGVPEARTSWYSRPPAPVFELDAADDDASDDEDEETEEWSADSEPPDPNATTLISSSGPRPSSSPRARISVEVAPDVDGDDYDDEAPVSAASSADAEEVASSLGGEFFRAQESTLAPVVDVADDDEDDALEPALLSPEESRRRRRLRRVVGVGVIAAGLLTVGLVAKSSLDDAKPVAAAQAAQVGPAIAKPPSEEAKPEKTPAEEAPIAAEPTAAEPTAAEPTAEVDIAATPPEDIVELEKQTVELLNERKFEEAIPFAEKLIAMKPESAFGYRCLGSALQDLGRYNEAQKVYSDCATHATKGEFMECTALGGANRAFLNKKK